MSAATNLKRRGAVYYARQIVPIDVRQAVGRHELQRSLETRDLRTAKARKLAVLAEWERQFEAARRRRDLIEADYAAATWEHYGLELERDQRERTWPIDADTRRYLADARKYHLAALREHLGRGETVLIHWAADAYIAERQLLVERGSTQYRELCFRLMRAQIEAVERAIEHDRGDYTGVPRDPAVVPAAPVEMAKPGETIRELFEQYALENPNNIAEATLNQARRDVGTFIDLKGEHFPPRAIDKKAAREWKAMLQRYPVKAVEIADFEGMDFRELIAANDAAEQPRKVISAGTVNRYMAGFGAFCNWLAAHDYIEENPFKAMYVKRDKRAGRAKVFTPEQLKVLFASPLFIGCKDDRDWHVPGEHRILDHRYWLPFLMMYSGARPGELAQLNVADVQEHHGHWVFNITDEGEGDKRVKTRGSNRVVPIHTKLITMGFLDYWRGMKEAGETRLFPEAQRNAAGQMAQQFETKFGRYLAKLGLKQGRGLSLYSFRHGFADAMRRAGHMDDEFGFLMGHSDGSMTAHYGHLQQGTLEKRVTMIEAVTY